VIIYLIVSLNYFRSALTHSARSYFCHDRHDLQQSNRPFQSLVYITGLMFYGISPTEKTELLRDDEMRRVSDFMSEKGGDFGIPVIGQRPICLVYHSGTNKAWLQYPLWLNRRLYFHINTDIRPKPGALRAAGRKSRLSPFVCCKIQIRRHTFSPNTPPHPLRHSLTQTPHRHTRTP
jgi:hypothetical protein